MSGRLAKIVFNFLNRKKIDIVFKDLILEAEMESEENRKQGIIDLYPAIVAENRLNTIIRTGKLNKKYNEILQGSVIQSL